ncbi:MAG: zinc-dependent alcohol dehydrogenase [Eubacteriales bacterium]
MRAAVVERPHVLVIKDIPEPIIGKDEFRIKVLASSICNATDNHIVEGIFDGYHDHYPQVLGHEVCGVIDFLGENVYNYKIGDRVVLYTPNGAFAEYVRVSKHSNCAIIPDNMSNEEAAICEMFDGSYTCMVAPAELKKEDKVLVIGAGPLGLTTIGAASQFSDYVIAVDFYKNRLDTAIKMGAKKVYNRSEMLSDEIIESIKRDVGEVDVVFMCIALDRSRELDAFYIPIEVLRYNGRMAGLNVEVKLQNHNHKMNPFHMNRKNIKYRHMLERDARSEDFQYGINLVSEGKIPMKEMITHYIKFEELPEALRLCHEELDKTIKIIVYPDR